MKYQPRFPVGAVIMARYHVPISRVLEVVKIDFGAFDFASAGLWAASPLRARRRAAAFPYFIGRRFRHSAAAVAGASGQPRHHDMPRREVVLSNIDRL